MRSRNVKPGFFKNADLAELPFECRLLFQGLWCLADRKGRLVDRPKQIKGEVFPYDAVDVSTMLDQLQHHAFILRYERDQNKYIQIVNFEKHQYPHIKEADSTIPAPYKNGSNTIPVRLNPESPLLNPESPIPPSGAFELIWSKYPRREGHKLALKYFNGSVKTLQDWNDIQTALDNYLAKLARDGTEAKYIKMGATWFNDWRSWISYEEPIVKTPQARIPEWQYK